MFYKVCGNCGANLDPGESCDCTREKARTTTTNPRRNTVHIATKNIGASCKSVLKAK